MPFLFSVLVSQPWLYLAMDRCLAIMLVDGGDRRRLLLEIGDACCDECFVGLGGRWRCCVWDCLLTWHVESLSVCPLLSAVTRQSLMSKIQILSRWSSSHHHHEEEKEEEDECQANLLSSLQWELSLSSPLAASSSPATWLLFIIVPYDFVSALLDENILLFFRREQPPSNKVS